MKQQQTTYKTNSYTYNSFSSSGNINIDYETESQTNADSKMKTISNGNANNEETRKQFENDDKIKPMESTIVEHHTEPIDHIEVDQLYMDDGAATEEKTSPSTEDFHDDDDEVANDGSIQLGMLRSRTFFPDDEDDDDDDDDRKGGDRAEHSGAGGIDKYGDYENDNVQNRGTDRQYKHKNSFSSLDDKGKAHENDDFDRHPYQSSKADSKDAIKIISTPLGKVSIIYQSNTNNNNNSTTANNSNDSKTKLFDNSNQNSMNKFKNFFSHNINAGAKQNSTNSYRMNKNQHHRHNHHQHYHQQQQAASSSSTSSLPVANGADTTSKSRPNSMNDKTKLLQKQITPVLTADGKVALLYRGAQDTNNQHKVEVGKNLTDFTQSVNSQESVINGKMNYNVVSESEPKLPDGIPIETVVAAAANANNQTEKIAIKNTEKLAVIVAAETTTTTTRTKLTTFAPVANTERPVLKLFKSDENTSRNTNEEENSILPNINRPPSEVLGIKKNQFTQFRITDMIATATPTLTSQDVTEKTPLLYGNEVPKAIDSLNNEHDPHGQDGFGSSIDYDYNANRENGYHHHNPNHMETPSVDVPANHGFDDSTTISELSKAEVVNLAIIPAFEGDLHRFHEQQQNDVSNDNNPYFNMEDDENGNDVAVAGKQHKHRHHKIKDLSALHCAMQALVAIAALATVFGMLGAYFKQRILDQLTIMHW